MAVLHFCNLPNLMLRMDLTSSPHRSCASWLHGVQRATPAAENDRTAEALDYPACLQSHLSAPWLAAHSQRKTRAWILLCSPRATRAPFLQRLPTNPTQTVLRQPAARGILDENPAHLTALCCWKHPQLCWSSLHCVNLFLNIENSLPEIFVLEVSFNTYKDGCRDSSGEKKKIFATIMIKFSSLQALTSKNLTVPICASVLTPL